MGKLINRTVESARRWGDRHPETITNVDDWMSDPANDLAMTIINGVFEAILFPFVSIPCVLRWMNRIIDEVDYYMSDK